jgi:hypothetical protein
MQVFICSKGRARTIATHKVFPEAVVVVHSHEEAQRYLSYNPDMRLAVSGTPADTFGLTRQREWVCQNLVRRDEWFVFADDNIKCLQALVDPWYAVEDAGVEMETCSYWRSQFNVECSQERFFGVIAPDTIRYCESVGAHLAGFTLTDNVLFRSRKFRPVGYVIGKMMLWHNTGKIPFNHDISMEDFYHTAMNLKVFGACVVNNFCRPKAGHYEEGGMGRYEDRVPVRRQDVDKLLRMFPEMFRVKNRKGFEPDTDLQLRITAAGVGAWRQKHAA